MCRVVRGFRGVVERLRRVVRGFYGIVERFYGVAFSFYHAVIQVCGGVNASVCAVIRGFRRLFSRCDENFCGLWRVGESRGL